jgi:class 3 adenylate cyclase/tetratricopeptide (TPR) repeat protein
MQGSELAGSAHATETPLTDEPAAMSFLQTIESVRAFLERNGRVSLRALQREFDLDTNACDELVEELVDVQQVASREGQILVWAGPASSAQTAPMTPVERAPSDYTPKHLADKILRTKSAMEGERKQVTVLFADVQGSMELAAELGAERWHGILDRFFAILSEGVHRFEGTVNQFTGDGIMALFGAPIAHEDHAQRACFASLHLRNTLRAYADELRRTQGLNLSVRIGMNSGEVVVGKIGDDLRMDYTAQGHVVGLAKRMEALAEPGCAYLTADAARLVEGYFELRDLGEFEIAGSNEPVGVCALEGVGRFKTRLDLSRARGFSRFVGRGREMQRLEIALERAASGEGQVVCVVADAGVGKSRLCSEFLERCRARGTLVNETHCPAHGKTIPLLPILGLLRSFFRIDEADSDAEARRKIAGTLVLLDEAFSETLPLVFDFLGVPDPDRPAPELDPDDRSRQLLDFVQRFVRARSGNEPAVILVDDLHWVDPGSDAFVAQLVAAVREANTFLLLNYRPEYQSEWLRRPHVEQLALVPLGKDAICELVVDLVGDDPSLAELPARIFERTGGNPFFTEEVVQSLIESGQLQGSRGAFRLVTPIDRIDVPDRVQAVLAARIDRLAEREKKVLQGAAVIGRNFDAELLEAVVEINAVELRAALETLDTSEMVRATALYPLAQYSFKHPLTHQVALESQLGDARARRHGAVARELVTRHANKLDENAALLAYHFEASGAALEAARWHGRAAEWIGFNDVDESARHAQSVRDLAIGYDGAEVADLVLSASYRLMTFQSQQGSQREKFRELLDEGRLLAKQSTDPGAFPQLLMGYANTCVLVGDIAEGFGFFEEAERLASGLPDPGLGLEAGTFLAWAEISLGRLSDAVERCRPIIVSGCRHEATFGAPVDSLAGVMQMWALFERGMLATCLQVAQQTRRLQQGARLSVLAKIGTGMTECRALAHQGELERALRIAADLVEAAQRGRNANLISLAMMCTGEVEILRGRFTEARIALEEAKRVARQTETMLNLEARTLFLLARAYLGEGARAEALATSEEAISIAQQRGARHHEAAAHVVRADVHLTLSGLDRTAEIESAHAHAAELIEQTGAGIVTPDLHLSRARLAELREDRSARQRALENALACLEEMGARLRAGEVANELAS